MAHPHVTRALEQLRYQAQQAREDRASAANGGPSGDDMPAIIPFTHPETVALMTPDERAEHEALTKEIHAHANEA